MKKIKQLVILTLISILSVSTIKAETITIATEALYPPFVNIVKNKMVGFDVELANTIAKNLGYETKWVDMQFATIFPSISSGKADIAINGISITPEREKTFDFSVPYYRDNFAILVKKQEKISKLEDIANSKICVQLGSTGEVWAKSNLKAENITSMDSTLQCLEALKANIVTSALISSSQTKPYLEKNRGIKKAFAIGEGEPIGIMFPKNSKYYKEFNNELQKLINNGFVDSLIKKWL